MERKIVAIRYYNVWFYLRLRSQLDFVKVSYLSERIEAGEKILMKDLYQWCNSQNIDFSTQFVYRKEFSFKANAWNLYSYLRWKIEIRVGNNVN